MPNSKAPNEVLTAVSIPPIPMEGDLGVPPRAKGLVIFAHGSGSSRFSSRNRFVAERLRDAGFATLLLDLLTVEEEQNQDLRFDIPLLAERVAAATDWARANTSTRDMRIACFGASTGAAAALVAAAERQDDILSVVSRGGRPDLAGAALTAVRAPTLLVVGSVDEVVLELNRDALTQLNRRSRLAIVPGATHLFEEPGTLEEVAALAIDWLDRTPSS